MLLAISYLYMAKSKGLKTEPCGTPRSIFIISDFLDTSWTYCLVPDKYAGGACDLGYRTHGLHCHSKLFECQTVSRMKFNTSIDPIGANLFLMNPYWFELVHLVVLKKITELLIITCSKTLEKAGMYRNWFVV